MRVKADLRQQFGIITARANDLLKALHDVPGTAEALIDAAAILTPQERAQVVHYLTTFAATLYQVREHTLYIKRALDVP